MRFSIVVICLVIFFVGYIVCQNNKNFDRKHTARKLAEAKAAAAAQPKRVLESSPVPLTKEVEQKVKDSRVNKKLKVAKELAAATSARASRAARNLAHDEL
eukprot:TRINITY_DN8791_c0_g1_i1.p1 TRINITY_DN8791_c0_g1~~TRINITY_DN8791_c0_g1_i1.p1  ORF type:complete len:101 (+),score=21.82 TRINITY_DN8791_c0_g1_i1:67-369(+)